VIDSGPAEIALATLADTDGLPDDCALTSKDPYENNVTKMSKVHARASLDVWRNANVEA
jgi:hypothetical protein